ncbi:hypothetical protein MGYG_04019 [Nannizzia gypsea CBS 118893]|uniref:Uncharacterized protein n=1 Tax=Arthroderma gypseum (strain ATCC MYA-4604 / CBS 118893) TaxID=535722 RepID=E4UUQ0_ARTGP|nr:hypothetical protein MGYG_04019 [Nannizzia gypsea CBS 118893]EFR01017.1 hypothetical protein MGYG_04019 [Nannizzia gypsea CBS 118893]
MGSTNLFVLVRRVSTSLQTGTGIGRRDVQSQSPSQSQAEQEEYLAYALFMADFVLLLAAAVYVVLVVVICWKYIFAAVTMIGRSSVSRCRRAVGQVAGRHRHGHNRHGRRRGIDVEAYEGCYTPEELELEDDGGREDDNDDEENDLAELAHQPPLDDIRHSLDNIDGMDSLGISKYFDPTTGKLRLDIVHPTQTALDRMLGEKKEGHKSIAWYKALQRFSDNFILKAQAWLDKEDENDGRSKHGEASVLCDEESNKAVRRILRERAGNGGYEDAEDNMY